MTNTMKDETHLDIWAEKIVKQTGFVLVKEIYRGCYYSSDKIRNLIFSGSYKDRPAVLKIYNDPRPTDEPITLSNFNRSNRSKILRAPEVYSYKVVSPKKGWLIMERLPKESYSFERPLDPRDRKEFLKLYLEYRKNFSKRPTRKLMLPENLPAHEFHVLRIAYWFKLANDKEMELTIAGKKSILKPKEFISRYEKGLELIRREFKSRKMIWCHGHFNPAEVFKMPDKSIYYLTDFAHTKMYPEGYEFGFIIWSDWLMHGESRMSYSRWKKEIDNWLSEFKPIAKKLKVKRFNSLMRASLVERSLGTILADICASDGPREEKIRRINLIYRLLDDLLKY